MQSGCKIRVPRPSYHPPFSAGFESWPQFLLSSLKQNIMVSTEQTKTHGGAMLSAGKAPACMGTRIHYFWCLVNPQRRCTLSSDNLVGWPADVRTRRYWVRFLEGSLFVALGIIFKNGKLSFPTHDGAPDAKLGGNGSYWRRTSFKMGLAHSKYPPQDQKSVLFGCTGLEEDAATKI